MTSTPDAEEPEESPPDMDAAFNAIVAGMRHGERPPEVPTWPVAEDDESTSATPADAPTAPTLGSAWSGWEDVAVRPELPTPDSSEQEHYIPPPPPPVPRGDTTIRWAWAGAVGSPLLALLLGLIGWQFSGLVGLGLVAAFLAGFITLISRLRERPTGEDDTDNGAVV